MPSLLFLRLLLSLSTVYALERTILCIFMLRSCMGGIICFRLFSEKCTIPIHFSSANPLSTPIRLAANTLTRTHTLTHTHTHTDTHENQVTQVIGPHRRLASVAGLQMTHRAQGGEQNFAPTFCPTNSTKSWHVLVHLSEACLLLLTPVQLTAHLGVFCVYINTNAWINTQSSDKIGVGTNRHQLDFRGELSFGLTHFR